MQLVTSRHQLLLSCHRSQILHSVYKQQIKQLDEESSHAYLRFVPFGHSTVASSNGNIDLDSYISEARDSKAFNFEKLETLKYMYM